MSSRAKRLLTTESRTCVSYLSPNFSIVDIDRAFRTIAIETANEFCAELNRDVPGFAWIVIKYTKVEAFKEV